MASGALSTFQMTQDVIANRPTPAAYLGFWYATDQGTLYYSNGVKWITLGTNDVAVALHSGFYYATQLFAGTTTSATLVNQTLRFTPFYVPRDLVLTRIAVETTVVGDAGSVLRLGIYADDGTGLPGVLISDVGTIAGDVVAVQEIIINQALTAGSYWIAQVLQGAPVTQPTFRTPSGFIGQIGQAALFVAGQAPFGYSAAGVAGALPNPAPAVLAGGTFGARVLVKVA